MVPERTADVLNAAKWRIICQLAALPTFNKRDVTLGDNWGTNKELRYSAAAPQPER